MNIKRPSHGVIVAYLALFVALTGTATAASGGTFVLGRSNTASSVTTLSNSAGTPLSLGAKAGYAPLKVNSSVKVVNLNSDKLDGIDSTQLQRPTSRTCTYGFASLTQAGVATCANGNSDTIDGIDSAQLQRPTSNICTYGFASLTQAGVATCATSDADTLDGFNSTDFVKASNATPPVGSNFVQAIGDGTGNFVTSSLTYVDVSPSLGVSLDVKNGDRVWLNFVANTFRTGDDRIFQYLTFSVNGTSIDFGPYEGRRGGLMASYFIPRSDVPGTGINQVNMTYFWTSDFTGRVTFTPQHKKIIPSGGSGDVQVSNNNDVIPITTAINLGH